VTPKAFVPTVAALLVSAALAAPPVRAEEAPAPPPSISTRLDALARDSAKLDIAREGFELAQKAHAASPEGFDAAWRLARASFFYGYALAERDPKERKRVGLIGYEAGRVATRAKPDRVEGWYWGACAMGEFGQAAGIFEAIKEGVATNIKEMFERAIAIDPDYHEAAPLEALGAYYLVLPWPLKDLKKAKGLLEDAIGRAPKRVRIHAYLGDLYGALGEKAKAQRHYGTCAALPMRLEVEVDAPKWRAHCAKKASPPP
jgi:tetratricopeptide (TPR) repeat protein